MSESHEHLPEDEAPLGAVDPGALAGLHAAVDALAATLHTYVDTAAGVRREFGVADADVDPRVMALEAQVSGLNLRLYDEIHELLGLHAHLTGLAVEGEEEDEEDLTGYETFHLGFLVGPQAGAGVSLDEVLGLVDDAGAEIARHLLERRYDVPEWGSARGVPVLFEQDEIGEDPGDGSGDGPGDGPGRPA